MMDQNDFNKSVALLVGFLIGAWLALSPVRAHAEVVHACSTNPGPTSCPDSPIRQYQTGSVPANYYVRTVPVGQTINDANTTWRGTGSTGTYQTVVCTSGSWTETSCSAYAWQTLLIDGFWGASPPQSPTVTCIPSARTIAPCPAGYAPSVAEPLSSNPSDQYTSAFDALPLQDMIYALGVALCGLFGVAVGVRLT